MSVPAILWRTWREPPPWLHPGGVAEYLLQTWADVLSSWDVKFCTSVSAQIYRATPRQREVLDNIATKVRRYAARTQQ